jgi:hypothetical protein
VGVTFLTLLGCGKLGVLALCRLEQVAWTFVRLIAILALAELSLAITGYVAFSGQTFGKAGLTARLLLAAAGFCAFLVLGLAPMVLRFRAAVRALSAAGGVLALAATAAWAIHHGIWTPAPRFVAAAIPLTALSALLLGAVSLAMLLGHAYLTHTEMTIQPLRRLAMLLAIFMSARVALALVSALAGWNAVRRGALYSDLLREETLVMVLRYGVGLALPAIFCYMVWRTVRLRATQSATGILYFGLVLIYIGELSAMHLTRELGIPF